jgi:hypothetical protein
MKMASGSNNPSSWCLWHRVNRRQRWQAAGTGPTSASLTALLPTLPSGECVALPGGEHPDDFAKRRATVQPARRPGGSGRR